MFNYSNQISGKINVLIKDNKMLKLSKFHFFDKLPLFIIQWKNFWYHLL